MTTLSVLSFVADMLQFAFNGFLGLLEGFVNHITSSFGFSISAILSNWAMSINNYGVIAPIVLVAVIGLSGAVGYAAIDLIGTARDAMFL